MVQLQVTIPQGYGPGMVMPVMGPHGDVVPVQVPANAFPGTLVTFPIQVPVQAALNQPSQQPAFNQTPMNQAMDRPAVQQNMRQSWQGTNQSSTSQDQELESTSYLDEKPKPMGLSGSYFLCCCFGGRSLDSMSAVQATLALYCCASAAGTAACLPCYHHALYVIGQDEVGIVEKFGKFERLEHSGAATLYQPFPCCCEYESMKARLNLRVQQYSVTTETKTKDNVFCTVRITVQYCVRPECAYDAYYTLESFDGLVEPLVSDTVRNKLARLEIDHVFEAKDELQGTVREKLATDLDPYGFSVKSVLVTGLSPDSKVKREMNSIYAARMEKLASEELAEGQKIISVKMSEADAERKALLGVGTARQRAAIASGLDAAISDFATEMTEGGCDMSKEGALRMQLLLNYFDSQVEITKDNPSVTNLVLETELGSLERMKGALSPTQSN